MHPLGLFTLGYIGGLLAGGLPWLGPFGAFWLAALLAALALLARRISGLRRAIPVASPLALLLLSGGAAGALLVPAVHRWALPAHHLLVHLPRERANVIGHLSQPIEMSGHPSQDRPRLHVRVSRMLIRGVEVPARGTLRVTAAGPLPAPLSVGDRLLLRQIRLTPPRRHLNPGDFDYREFLRLRRIHAVAYASPRAIERLAPRETFAWRRAIFTFRDAMRAHIRRAFAPEVAALLEAITLGVREDLPPEIRDAFRLAGVSHLLAISGLHVGFISAFFYFLLLAAFRRLPPEAFPAAPLVATPAKLAALGAIPIIVLFTILTGARISTVRAAIMAVVYLLTRLLERPGGALHSIFLAALIILVLEPGFVWDAGFQLSFIAVAAILLALARHSATRAGDAPPQGGKWKTRLVQFAIIQGAVSLAMAPLTAYHFQEVHLAGLLTNFILIPIASLLVPLTFLASSFSASAWFLGGFSLHGLLLPFDAALEWLGQLMIHVARISAAIPAGTIDVAPPSPYLIAAFLIAFAAALVLRSARQRRWSWGAAALAMAFIVTPFGRANSSPAGHTVLMVPDGGQDDVFFVRLSDGRGFAVDAGRKTRSRFDTWKNLFGPLLRTLHEREWEALFLLGNKGPGSTAEQELQAGLRLGRVIQIGRRGGIRTWTPGGESAETFAASPPWKKQTLWRAASGESALSLRHFGPGHLGFLLTHRKARWVFLFQRSRRRIRKADLPSGSFDLVRLPEPMLRERFVLQWLERIRPRAVISAPGRTKRLPLEEWRRIRERQRALGVYRPHRQGMLRVVTDGSAVGRGARAERFRQTAPWPRASAGQWVRLTPAASDRPVRSSRESGAIPETLETP